MEILSMQTDFVLGLTAAVSFALGWITHRYLLARRERRAIELLISQIGRLERQRDAAHRVALDLAATHSDLVKEHEKAEWKISNFTSKLSLSRPKSGKSVEGYDVLEMDDASWPLLKVAQ